MGAFFRWLFSGIGQLLFDSSRTASAQAVVRTLAIAVEKDVPVAPVLEALADEEGSDWRFRIWYLFLPLLLLKVIAQIGGQSRRLRLQKLADLLTSGTPIPEALDSVPGLLPEECLATIRVGFEVGRPAEALRETADYLGRQADSKSRITGGTLVYVATVGLVGVSLLTFLAIFIIPKLRAIYGGFGLRLPWLTQWMIDGFSSISRNWYLVFWPVLGAVIGAFILYGFFSELLRQGIYWRPRTWLSMLVPRIQAPLVLRCLGLAVDAGQPAEKALISINANTRDRYLQLRLAQILERVQQGAPPWQALHEAEIITAREVRVLETSARTGSLGWALKQTALALERQSAARMRFLIDFSRPLVFLAMGTVVGVVAFAMFLPLIELIRGLGES